MNKLSNKEIFVLCKNKVKSLDATKQYKLFMRYVALRNKYYNLCFD